MVNLQNDLGQPIGMPVANWRPPPTPSPETLVGRYCQLEPLNVGRHASELFAAFSSDHTGRNWTYMQYGPFASFAQFREWMVHHWLGMDPLFFAVCGSNGTEAQQLNTLTPAEIRPLGMASYLRIAPQAGTIEVGNLNFSESLQRTPIATEGLFLMFDRAFSLGYRRLEWKCDSLNMASRRAAQRFGFSFEGIFRQAIIYKGRNRDTSWYSIIDSEWGDLREKFRRWLDPTNFDAQGQQRVRLSDLTRPLLKSVG